MNDNLSPPKVDAFRALYQEAHDGSRAAFELLMQPYCPLIDKAIRKSFVTKLQAKFDSADVEQAVLMEVWLTFDQFQGSTEREWIS